MYKKEKIIIGIALFWAFSMVGLLALISVSINKAPITGASGKYGMPAIYKSAAQTLSDSEGSALFLDADGKLKTTGYGKTSSDGTVSGAYSSTTAPSLLVARNANRESLQITNAGSEALFLWEVNHTTASASTTVTRLGGLYLAAGGSYYTPDDGVLWTGDIWMSTTSAINLITYSEK